MSAQKKPSLVQPKETHLSDETPITQQDPPATLETPSWGDFTMRDGDAGPALWTDAWGEQTLREQEEAQAALLSLLDAAAKADLGYTSPSLDSFSNASPLLQGPQQDDPTTCSFTDCPDENQFVALLQGQLSPQEVQRLEEVMDRCVYCSELMIEIAQTMRPQEEPSTPEQRPLRIGRYHLEGLLGTGGMGVVYAAQDQELGRKVAIKLLRPDVTDPELRDAHKARMIQEARLLASLSHPHILTIYEVGTWNEQIFMAIQYVDGLNLRQWLDDHNPRWDEILRMFCVVGEALVAAHTADIIHRDIKPDNILVSRNGDIFLTDFGLARISQTTHHSISAFLDKYPTIAEHRLTAVGDILGTPAYMSPEHFRGRGVGKRSDQFSFCVALYEALYGMLPFGGHNVQQIMEAAESGHLETPRQSSVPQAVFRVLRQGLHPLPRERFGSMKELLDALRRAQHTTQQRRTLLPIALIALASLLVSLALFAFFRAPSSLPLRSSNKPPQDQTNASSLKKDPPTGKTKPLSSQRERFADPTPSLPTYSNPTRPAFLQQAKSTRSFFPAQTHSNHTPLLQQAKSNSTLHLQQRPSKRLLFPEQVKLTPTPKNTYPKKE